MIALIKLAVAAAAVIAVPSCAGPLTTLASTDRESPGSITSYTEETRDVLDPLTTDGTWLVPGDIAPGNYRVQVVSNFGGYSEVCGDLACEIGTRGFLGNELYNGPGVLVIPPDAVAVKIARITLTPMGVAS